jgi:hypothetical protein
MFGLLFAETSGIDQFLVDVYRESSSATAGRVEAKRFICGTKNDDWLFDNNSY